MQIVYEVLMDTGRILALLLVSFAFCISAMILFKPIWVSTLNQKFNQLYNTNLMFRKMDQRVQTTELFLRHRLWIGSLFLAGSLFVLWYSAGVLDVGKFITYVIKPASRSAEFFSEMLMTSLRWLFIIVSAVGVVTAVTILASPDRFRRFSQKLDQIFSTDETIERLESLNTSLDSWVLRHHVVVGGLLLVGSIFLIVVCLKVLMT